MAQIRDALAHEGATLGELFRPGVRRALCVGTGLAVFTQVTGINAIMYYAPKVFTEAGFGTAAAYWCGVWVGLTNLVFTLASMAVVDYLGRRSLLLIGATCMGVALLFVGYGFHAKLSGPALLGGVLAYVGSFAFSMGVVGWVVISEIYPTRIRGRAMAVATAAVWGACYLVSVTFPGLLAWVGSSATFWTYAAMCVGAILFVWWLVPETKGRSLEDIERAWLASGSANG
jgi:SP family arabinose:H+ symporter-like MFS transporter